MGKQDDGKSSISGLAKRWLKNQISFGNPQQAYRQRQESEAIEQEIEDRTSQQAQETVARGLYQAFAPAGLKQKVSELQRMTEQHRADEEARHRAEHEAKPRADVRLRISGALNGSLEAALPATIDRPEEERTELFVTLEPLASEEIAGRAFQMLTFAIPGYHGAGTYDIERLAQGGAADDWDPLWFQLVLDEESEPFYWTPDGGAAVATVDEGEQAIHLRIQMTNAGSEDITVTADIALP